MVDIDAGQLVADGLVDQHSRNRGIDAAGKAADDALGTDLVLDLADHFGAVGGHRPVRLQADDLVHEVGEQLGAVRRMDDFRVEHGRIVVAALVGCDRERRVLGGRDDLKTLRQLRDAVAMAHPDGITTSDFPETVKQRAGLLDLDIGAAEFGGVTTLDDTAELSRQCLLAVADAEDRHIVLEYDLRRARTAFRGHRSRTTGEDDAFGLEFLERGVRVLEGVDFAVDAGFANATRDQLRHLAAEIDDENAVGMSYLGHGEPLKKVPHSGNRDSAGNQPVIAGLRHPQGPRKARRGHSPASCRSHAGIRSSR